MSHHPVQFPSLGTAVAALTNIQRNFDPTNTLHFRRLSPSDAGTLNVYIRSLNQLPWTVKIVEVENGTVEAWVVPSLGSAGLAQDLEVAAPFMNNDELGWSMAFAQAIDSISHLLAHEFQSQSSQEDLFTIKLNDEQELTLLFEEHRNLRYWGAGHRQWHTFRTVIGRETPNAIAASVQNVLEDARRYYERDHPKGSLAMVI